MIKIIVFIVLGTMTFTLKAQEDNLHFFHQYSIENSFVQFSTTRDLKAKTDVSNIPSFGVGVRKETTHFIFSFGTSWGLQRSNFKFQYQGKQLKDTYSIDYAYSKRQFLLGFRLNSKETFSFLFANSFNIFNGASYDRLFIFQQQEFNSQKLQLEKNLSEVDFFDNRLGFEYEFKPSEDEKLKLFWRIEASLRQRHITTAANPNLGINKSYKFSYQLFIFSFGFRF